MSDLNIGQRRCDKCGYIGSTSIHDKCWCDREDSLEEAATPIEQLEKKIDEVLDAETAESLKGWLHEKQKGQGEPRPLNALVIHHCIFCDEEIKRIGGADEDNKDYEGMFDGGIVERISAGYGSRLDGEMYVIAICDDCIEEKHEEGKLSFIGDYIMSNNPKGV